MPISNIKVSKDGSGVINFPDKATRDDGLSKLKEQFNVHANNQPGRVLLPKITISNIDSNDYKANDTLKLKQSICDKNPILKELIEKGKIFEVLFIKEDYRKTRSCVAAVKVDREIYDAIRSLHFQVFIDFSRCRVSDRYHVTQCYRCQKFGHTKSNCTLKNESIQVCRYCGENHDGKSCVHKGTNLCTSVPTADKITPPHMLDVKYCKTKLSTSRAEHREWKNSQKTTYVPTSL